MFQATGTDIKETSIFWFFIYKAGVCQIDAMVLCRIRKLLVMYWSKTRTSLRFILRKARFFRSIFSVFNRYSWGQILLGMILFVLGLHFTRCVCFIFVNDTKRATIHLLNWRWEYNLIRYNMIQRRNSRSGNIWVTHHRELQLLYMYIHFLILCALHIYVFYSWRL